MAARRYTLLDVFTSTRLQGNPLAVVHDADGVPDPVMHAFARETRLSETSFVQTPSAAGADYRNRIWMMSGEVPFAGHPSLGVAAAVARERGEASVTYTQETQAGLQPIDVELAGGAIHASMLQEPAVFGPELDPSDVLGAVGLSEDDAHPELPCQAVSTGAFHVLAPVRDAAVLAGLWPDYDRIASLLAPFAGGLCLYVAADRSRRRHGARTLVRAPAPRWARTRRPGPPRDRSAPTSRSAPPRSGVTISQGVEMGRASRLVARDGGRSRARRRRRGGRLPTAASSWTPDRTGAARLHRPAAARRSEDQARQLPRNGGRREARLALPTRHFAGPRRRGRLLPRCARAAPAPGSLRGPRARARTSPRGPEPPRSTSRPQPVEARGIEPLTPACKAGVFPLAPRPRLRDEG